MKDDWYKNESLHLVLIVRRSEWESRWEQQSVLFNIVCKREIKPKIVHHHQVQIDTNQAKHKNSFMPFGNFKSKQIIKGLEMVKPEQQKNLLRPCDADKNFYLIIISSLRQLWNLWGGSQASGGHWWRRRRCRGEDGQDRGQGVREAVRPRRVPNGGLLWEGKSPHLQRWVGQSYKQLLIVGNLK